jgi:autotransporter-associated beta strand protein
MKSSHVQRHPIASNKLLAALVAFSGSAALIVPMAHAQATWTGAADQDWNNVANWSTSPSNPTGAFTVNLATGNYPILSANSAFSPNNILLGDGASQTGRFDHRAGSLSQAVVGASGNWFQVGTNGGTGTYNLADTSGIGGTLTGFAQGTGSLTVGKLWVGGVSGGAAGTGTVNINTSGTINAQSTATFSNHGGVSIIVGTSGGSGTLNLDNGTVNAAGIVDVGSAFAGAQATQGTLNISGGVFNSEGDFRTAFAGSTGAQATVNLSGGTLNVGSGTKRWMILGRFDGAKSTVNVSGGNLNLNTNTDIRFAQGGTGTHVINLNSGAITSYSGNQAGLGAGVVDMMQGNVAANNTFNLNGGTLTVRQVISNFSNGTRTFNFNGGTLKATGNATGAANAAFFHLGTGSARANVRNGGALIDTNGFNVAVVQSLQHSNVGGDNAVDGGLAKNGTGTLILSAANTFNGPTKVNAGTLELANVNALQKSALDLTGAGAFTFTVVGTNTYNIGGTKGAGALAVGSNSLAMDAAAGSSLSIADAAAYQSSPAVSVTGAGLAFNGTLNVSVDSLLSPGSHTFDLFGGTATLSGSFANISIGGSYTATLDSGNSYSFTDMSGNTFSFNNATGDLAISAVPEPSTFAAFAGLAGLAVVGARRRRRASV